MTGHVRGDARKKLLEDTAPGSDWPHIIPADDLEQIKRDAWQEGWEHHRQHPRPIDPDFGINPYDSVSDAAFQKALAETRTEYREALDRLSDDAPSTGGAA